MSKILMVASEATPFAKTGGLADVMGSLPYALRQRGEEVAVIMPRYRRVSLENASRIYADRTVWVGGRPHRVDVFQINHREVPYYFVDCPPLFDRDGLYGDADGDFPDNPRRFAVLCRAALVVIRYLFRPQVVHCHDWQSALMPIYMRHTFDLDPTFVGIPCLFTIHNLGYQGIFPPDSLSEMGLDPELLRIDALEYYGKVNLLKGAILSSDAINTVSPTYARESQEPEFGFGLDGVLRTRANLITGILNGVDYTSWNPETDPHIAANYSADSLAGKRLCKQDLLEAFGLPAGNLDRPLIGIISRFANQKGFDLIAEVAHKIAAEDVALVALGTGDPEYEQLFRDLAAAYPDRFGTRIAYDDTLAHKIEAGSDLFLMPSWFEPCGLNQMYSLRYGTVPIVRATGGLDDSISEETGFKFREYSGKALLDTVRRALQSYADSIEWQRRMRRGMAQDYSWDASAVRYSLLYQSLVS